MLKSHSERKHQWMTPVTLLLTGTLSLPGIFISLFGAAVESQSGIAHHPSPTISLNVTYQAGPILRWALLRDDKWHLCWLKQNKPSAVPRLLNRTPQYPLATLAYLTVNVASGLVRLSVYVDQLTAGYAGVSSAAQWGEYSEAFSP